MATGTIASLRDRGFGFIMPDGASGRGDLFFHRSAVADASFEQLREGQRVNFDEEPDPRDASRRRAVNVRTVDGDGAATEE
jgi:CspA family cold shock protein